MRACLLIDLRRKRQIPAEGGSADDFCSSMEHGSTLALARWLGPFGWEGLSSNGIPSLRASLGSLALFDDRGETPPTLALRLPAMKQLVKTSWTTLASKLPDPPCEMRQAHQTASLPGSMGLPCSVALRQPLAPFPATPRLTLAPWPLPSRSAQFSGERGPVARWEHLDRLHWTDSSVHMFHTPQHAALRSSLTLFGPLLLLLLSRWWRPSRIPSLFEIRPASFFQPRRRRLSSH